VSALVEPLGFDPAVAVAHLRKADRTLGRFIDRADQPENDTGDVVLRVRRKTAHRFERLIEKCCHHAWQILSLRWLGKASAFAAQCKH